MAAVESVIEQALQLNEDERGEVIARLLRSLEPDDGDELEGEAWEAAWGAEIERRVRSIDDGTATLIDADEVRAQIRRALDARRR